MTDDALTPAGFLGHGSPMNTLEHNRYTDAWRAFGACVPKPRAVLAISAHWYTNATAVTAMPQPRVIHDFYGFPDELFAFDYPAPGDPEIAELVAETVKPRWVGLDVDSWGLDHGTWSVLAHMFPNAEVPVVQLSINALQPLDYHLDLGARLAPLRKEGVLIVGSGNIVHNLRRINWDQPAGGFDWNRRFDEAATSLLRESPGDILKLVDHDDFNLAVPTPDHFIPLLYIAALAAATNDTPDVLIEGPCLWVDLDDQLHDWRGLPRSDQRDRGGAPARARCRAPRASQHLTDRRERAPYGRRHRDTTSRGGSAHRLRRAAAQDRKRAAHASAALPVSEPFRRP